MYNFFLQTFHRLIDECQTTSFRYKFDTFELNHRLKGLVGPRGVGKTTLLLQYIKKRYEKEDDMFYFSADHIYFNTNTLLEFVGILYMEEGFRRIFIDEIHKYHNWSQELKNIYDSYPELTICFSGSSALDIIKGTYDLSRRAVIDHLPGMSFREYINLTEKLDLPTHSFDDLVTNHVRISAKLSSIPRIQGLFKEYLRFGYYPFVFEGKDTLYEKIENIVNKTIYEDIANHYSLKTENLHYLFKILIFISTIPPAEVNIHSISKNLGIDSKTVLHYLHSMQATGLIQLLYSDKSGAALLRSPMKIFSSNPTLSYALCAAVGKEITIGSIRENYFVTSLKNADKDVFYLKKEGDYICEDVIFEIGGKSKSNKQIINHSDDKAFLVRDDALVGSKKSIPLYLFGFLY